MDSNVGASQSTVTEKDFWTIRDSQSEVIPVHTLLDGPYWSYCASAMPTSIHIINPLSANSKACSVYLNHLQWLCIHCRDDAAWCPYCQKVWLQLEEKRIPYTIEKINMRWALKPTKFI